MGGVLPEYPDPDFTELERVLKGEQEPRRVHLIELLIDEEVLQAIAKRYLGQPWVPSTEKPRETYFRQLITLYHRLGYDFVPVGCWGDVWIHHPPPKRRRTGDTAELSRGEREWVEESWGLISSWEEFEGFPWGEIKPDFFPFQFVAQNLPAGMKLVVAANLYEHVMEILLGYEGLFYMLHDEPELVAQVFDGWGRKVYDFYALVIGMEEVGAIFHPDDLGFKTSTMLPPDTLRQLVFPWFRKYAALAHEHGKQFWLHSCGNLYANGVIEDLIEDVQIDAFHSFQDVILPVADFKERYGDRVAALGGIDMDKLARLDEISLRAYVRDVLDQCMPGGRYALGSGNTIANYIPVKNYLIMLEEGFRWKPG